MSPQQPCPELEVQQAGDVIVAKFTHALIQEESAIERTGQHLLNLVTVTERPSILLDFGNLHHLSSGLLGKVIRLCKKTQAADGEVVLCAVKPELYQMFQDIHLKRSVTIVRDRNPAALGDGWTVEETAQPA